LGIRTRSGERTPLACARIALDLLAEKIITPEQARERTQHLSNDDLSSTKISSTKDAPGQLLGVGIPACNGVVSGEVAFNEDTVIARAPKGARVILLRQNAETLILQPSITLWVC